MSRRSRDAPPITLFSFQDIVTSVVGTIILVTLMLILELLHRRLSPGPEGAAASVAALRHAIGDEEKDIQDLQAQLGRKGEWVQELAQSSPEQLSRDRVVVQRQMESLATELNLLTRQHKRIRDEEAKLQALELERESDRRTLARLQATARTLHDQLGRIRREDYLVYNPSAGTGKRAWLVDVSAERFAISPLGHAGENLTFEERVVARRIAAFSNWARERSPNEEYFVLLIRPTAVTSFGVLRTNLERMGFDIGFDVVGAKQTVTTFAAQNARP
jgi:hypothetical protein